LFDVDETLYPRGSGVMEAIRMRIEQYMANRLGLAAAEAHALSARYRREYGTALTGLRAEYQVDADDYLAYVHDIPLSSYLKPSAELDRALAQLEWHKAIFTSSSRRHASGVLAALGIAHHFERIYDVSDTGYVGKPYVQAYRAVVEALGVHAADCVMIEDYLPNLKAPRDLGMITVLVGSSHEVDGVDFHIDRAEDIVTVARALARCREERDELVQRPSERR
jgi:putative hydrolase of the HAD superfamily